MKATKAIIAVAGYGTRRLPVSLPQDGEYYITDAINNFVAAGNKLAVHASDAAYLDCGTVEGWVRANQFLLDEKV